MPEMRKGGASWEKREERVWGYNGDILNIPAKHRTGMFLALAPCRIAFDPALPTENQNKESTDFLSKEKTSKPTAPSARTVWQERMTLLTLDMRAKAFESGMSVILMFSRSANS